MLEDRPTFKVYIKLRVKDDGIGRLVGIKSVMSISTYETNEVIEDRVSYNILKAELKVTLHIGPSSYPVFCLVILL